MRTIVGPDLLRWEAWSAPGRDGTSSQGVIVFRCLSDSRERPRIVGVEGGRPDAEARLGAASTDELMGLFERASPIS